MLSLSACDVFEFAAPPTNVGEMPPPPPIPPQAQAAQRTTPPPPAEAQEEMGRWFAAHGYRDYQIVALLQHARTESSFNACAVGPADLRYTFQWGGTRLRQLHTFAHTDGCPQIRAQMAFADWELRNDPKYSCFWGATNSASAYAALRRGFGAGSC